MAVVYSLAEAVTAILFIWTDRIELVISAVHRQRGAEQRLILRHSLAYRRSRAANG